MLYYISIFSYLAIHYNGILYYCTLSNIIADTDVYAHSSIVYALFAYNTCSVYTYIHVAYKVNSAESFNFILYTQYIRSQWYILYLGTFILFMWKIYALKKHCISSDLYVRLLNFIRSHFVKYINKNYIIHCKLFQPSRTF